MTTPEEPLRIPAADALRRPVDRRTFIRWAGGSSLAGLSLLGAFGGLGGGSAGFTAAQGRAPRRRPGGCRRR